MVVPFAMVSAVVPSLLLLWYFHSRDTFPEPGRVVWATFGFGALSIAAVLIVGVPILLVIEAAGIPSVYFAGFLKAFVTAAIPEEAAKLVVLAIYAGRHSAFDEPMDGIVYGVAASLGFATLENVMYCATGGIGLAIMRAVTAVPMHAGCGAVMGYYYGRSRFEPANRAGLLAMAYFAPMLLHGLYDTPLLALGDLAAQANAENNETIGALACGGIFFLLVTVVWALVVTRRAQRAQRARMAAMHQGPFADPPLHAPRGVPVATTGTKILGAMLIALGGIAASIGGLFTLGVGLALAMGEAGAEGPVPLVVGGVIIGVLPLAIGIAMFWYGIRVLNRPAAQRAGA
jgi:RsiW-degrading membrane proteinase PrsW (M82 family)